MRKVSYLDETGNSRMPVEIGSREATMIGGAADGGAW